MYKVCKGCSEGVHGVFKGCVQASGVYRVYLVSETAHVRLKSGQVQAPAFSAAALARGSVFVVLPAIRLGVGARVEFENRVTRYDMVMLSTR
jgi:hypothetical protein